MKVSPGRCASDDECLKGRLFDDENVEKPSTANKIRDIGIGPSQRLNSFVEGCIKLWSTTMNGFCRRTQELSCAPFIGSYFHSPCSKRVVYPVMVVSQRNMSLSISLKYSRLGKGASGTYRVSTAFNGVYPYYGSDRNGSDKPVVLNPTFEEERGSIVENLLFIELHIAND